MIETLTIYMEDSRPLKWDFDFSTHGTIQLTNLFLEEEEVPFWIQLSYCQCPACTLDTEIYPICPVAEVLSGYARDLAHRQSFERVKVDVYQTDAAKITLENIPLQNVVSELVRLAVFQYECPIGRHVKPAMTELPPFPTNDQILQAVAKAFSEDMPRRGKARDIEPHELMEQLHDLFGNLCVRLESMGSGDAHLNGIVILHSLASLFTLSAPELVAAVSTTDPGHGWPEAVEPQSL